MITVSNRRKQSVEVVVEWSRATHRDCPPEFRRVVEAAIWALNAMGTSHDIRNMILDLVFGETSFILGFVKGRSESSISLFRVGGMVYFDTADERRVLCERSRSDAWISYHITKDLTVQTVLTHRAVFVRHSIPHILTRLALYPLHLRYFQALVGPSFGVVVPPMSLLGVGAAFYMNLVQAVVGISTTHVQKDAVLLLDEVNGTHPDNFEFRKW